MFLLKKLGFFANTSSQETVLILQLKNGSSAPKPLVDFVMEKIATFQTTGLNMDPMAAYYLAQKCKDPNFKLMPYTIKVLNFHGLVDETGSVPVAVKDIVLSALSPIQDNSISVKFEDPRELHVHDVEILSL